MKLIICLIVGIAGAFIGQNVCKEPFFIWWAGALTALALQFIQN
jgi:hypothetical protein